jgi:excisionase family DNA binding protein
MGVFLSPHAINTASSEQPETYMPAQEAAEYSGYNLQYIRRLLSRGIVNGRKVGQVWLVRVSSLDEYLASIRGSDDRRYGPRVYQQYIDERQGQ